MGQFIFDPSLHCTKMKKSTIIIASIVLVLVVGVKSQRLNLFNNIKPKCGDGSQPTCTCSNGNVVNKNTLRQNRRNPCGDGTKPNCVCSDGSTAQRGEPAMMGPDQPAPGVSRPSVRMDLILTQPAFPRVLEALPSVKMEAPSLVLMEQTWDSSPTLLDEHCDYLKKISQSINTHQLK